MRDGGADRLVRRGEVSRDDPTALRADSDRGAQPLLGQPLDRAADGALASHAVSGQRARVCPRACDPRVGLVLGDGDGRRVHGDGMPGAALDLLGEHLGEARAGGGGVAVPARAGDPAALRAVLGRRCGGRLGGLRGGAAETVQQAHDQSSQSIVSVSRATGSASVTPAAPSPVIPSTSPSMLWRFSRRARSASVTGARRNEE